MDSVKIEYVAQENTKVGTHSFYPKPKSKGTFGFERMCKKAAKNTTVEEDTIRQAVREYMRVAQEALLEGYRVEIGEQFVTLWPNLRGSVKDELNQDGTVKRAVTAKDLTALKCKSRVGATVSAVFSSEFERQVKWVKTDRSGNLIDEEDDTLTNDETQGNEPQGTGEPTGNNTGGNTGSGENEDGE